MRQVVSILQGITLGLLSSAALSQSVEEVFEELIEAEMAGYASIDNYVIRTETMGVSSIEFYEKVSSFQENGLTHYVMRYVPLNELEERRNPDNPLNSATSGDLNRAADMIQQQGEVMQQEFERELASSGVGQLGGGALGGILLNPPPDEPWLSANPRDMTSMYATMLRGTAASRQNRETENPVGDARDNAAATQQIMSNSRIVGEQVIDGRPAIGISASDLNQTQNTNGQEFTLDSVTMWVDSERFVPLRLSMDGDLTADGQTQKMTIERDDSDYRQIQGCGSLTKPMQSVMRLGGVLTPEQQQQMAQAKEQLAEFEQQMSAMPAAQRDMIMRQMGPQMETMRQMVSGGGIEVQSRVLEVRCNATAEEALDMAVLGLGGL